MKNILQELEKVYYLIMKENGDEITKIITFSNDVNTAFEALMQTVNKAYVQNINPNKKIKVFLKKTRSGRCYLKVTGRDHNTVLIIKNNNTKYYEYTGIIGYKIYESELAKTLDLIQRKKLEESEIPKRFIKEEIPEIDLYEEMEIEKITTTCRELYLKRNEPRFVGFYNEPENKTGKIKKSTTNKGIMQERLNPILSYEIRKQELIKYHQKEIIRFQGTKSNNIFDAYIYIKNGYVLAIIEPISGLGYQYNLNLGFAEDYKEETLKEMIKATLEAEENIVMIDDAIIRKNHTTLENFKDNIEVFLKQADLDKKFAKKTENATKVYQKIKKK